MNGRGNTVAATFHYIYALSQVLLFDFLIRGNICDMTLECHDDGTLDGYLILL